MRDLSTRSIVGYLIAVLTVVLTTLIKLPIAGFFQQETPFLLFFAAIMLSAWYGGVGPGIVATILSATASTMFFQEASLDWRVFRVSVFVVEGVLISTLSGFMHAARARAERNEQLANGLKKTVTEVSEAEQRRLGRELHDGLGQHLTGVALLSRFLSQKLRAGSRPEAETAAEVAELVNESIDWTRELARGLSPMDLDRTTLPAALRELASKTNWLCRIPCIFEGPDRLTLLSDESTLNVYRVAQEAVNNAVKHARASRISLSLHGDGDMAVLTVTDDGTGMKPSGERDPASETSADVWSGSGEGGKGMGLEIMRYRAGVVGGTLDITTVQPHGTRVRCRFPAVSVPAISAKSGNPPVQSLARN
jgi:signal transduction histidine kinase